MQVTKGFPAPALLARTGPGSGRAWEVYGESDPSQRSRPCRWWEAQAAASQKLMQGLICTQSTEATAAYLQLLRSMPRSLMPLYTRGAALHWQQDWAATWSTSRGHGCWTGLRGSRSCTLMCTGPG